MVPLHNMLAFAGTAVVIVAIPGPSVLFAISRALTVGRRTAFLTVAGNTGGVLMQVAATAVGVGAFVQRFATAFSVIKYVGAAYIVYLGVQAIGHRRSMAEALARHVTPVGTWQALRDGFVVGATNPKSIVILVTVMPTFATPQAAGRTDYGRRFSPRERSVIPTAAPIAGARRPRQLQPMPLTSVAVRVSGA